MATLYWYGGSGTWNGAAVSPFSTKVPASFTASFDSPTATLTVTAVASGSIAIGDTIIGNGAGSGTTGVVTAFGTGSGGVGTYILGSVSTGSFTSRPCGAVIPIVGTPSSSDDVNFVATSTLNVGVTYTVTCTGAMNCRDINVSAAPVTFATGTSPTLAISGSMSLVAGTVWSSTGTITFNATTTGKTVTTNGVTLSGGVTFNGVGGGWTLGSALTSTGSISIVTGAFDTGNYNVTVVAFSIANNTTVRGATLGSSTLTISQAASTAFSCIGLTNLTFNAGTSQINLTGSLSGIGSGGLTFYNVAFTNTAATGITITGANTFNTLSFAGRTTVGITPVTFNANQTISTLTLNAGTAAAYRTFLASDTIGTQRTLNVTTLTAGAADYDFRDIAITGAAAPLTGTRFGDCKGNSGITFPAAKTVYWRVAAATNWGATGAVWSATNGGTADVTQFPLTQDTAVFPSSPTPYPSSGQSVTINANYNIGTIDMSARTANTMTLATGTTTPTIYGNWINGTGTTLTGTGQMTFAGRGTQAITSAGKSFSQVLNINSPSGSVVLQDAFNSGAGGVHSLTAGAFDCNGYNATWFRLTAAGNLAKTYAVGSATTSVTGGGVSAFNMGSGTNVSVTGTGTISMTASVAQTFGGGGIQTYPTLNQGGAGALTITGSNGFANITNSYSATGATTITFTAGTTTTVSSFTASGTAGKILTINSSVAGTPATLSDAGGTISVDYLSIRDSTATGGASWYAGANSTNVSGNTGWIFAAPSTYAYGNFLVFFS